MRIVVTAKLTSALRSVPEFHHDSAFARALGSSDEHVINLTSRLSESVEEALLN